jgi:hypothetical protein
VLQHVFVQPLKVILDHDLAADNSGLIDAALFGHCRKSLLPVASRAAGSDAKPIMRSVATGQHFGFGSSLPAADSTSSGSCVRAAPERKGTQRCNYGVRAESCRRDARQAPTRVNVRVGSVASQAIETGHWSMSGLPPKPEVNSRCWWVSRSANTGLFGHTLKRDRQYELRPIAIPAMADGSPQLF